MEFLGVRSFAQFSTGHAAQCSCKWCGVLKHIPAVVVKDDNSLTTPTATSRGETPILIEPKTFCKVPMC